MNIRPWQGIGWLSVWALFAAWEAATGGDMVKFLTGDGTLLFALGAFIYLFPRPRSWQHRASANIAWVATFVTATACVIWFMNR